jgi:hypothetical protein
MIEQIMFLGIGFLAACLLTVAFIPLVHARAVRLTERRHHEATFASVTEMQASKDHLRAEFAMSTRRLEIALEQTSTKAADHLSEVGKKAQEIRLLKTEFGKTAAGHQSEMARKSEELQRLRMRLEELSAKNPHESTQSEANCGKAMVDTARGGFDLGGHGKKDREIPLLKIDFDKAAAGASVLRFRVPERTRNSVRQFPKPSAISFRKPSVKWVAFFAACFFVVSLLLLGTRFDETDHQRIALLLRRDNAAFPITAVTKLAPGERPTTPMIKGLGQNSLARRKSEAVSRSATNILIIRGGRQETKPHAP